MIRYYFKDIFSCNMCGDAAENHKVMGLRLNKSQGFRPSKKTGISVGVVKCTNCGLIYSNPQPVPFEFHDHYGTPPENYWRESYFNWSPDYFKYQIDEALNLLGNKPGMTALDIGAGIGKAMLSMQHWGFEVYGLEPSAPFYERALSQMGIKEERLKLGAIESLDYEKEFFDFITFGAVFEHLYEPSKCLEKALAWLKPNGIIHLEVPSSNWLMSKIMNFYFRITGN